MKGRDVPPEEVLHGTLGGYRWHKNHGEKPCRPCRISWNKYHVLLTADKAKAAKIRRQEVQRG